MLSTNSGYNMLNRYQWKCKIAFRDIFNSVFKVCKWGTRGTSGTLDTMSRRVHEMLVQKSKLFTVIPGTNLLPMVTCNKLVPGITV